jgi:hypothetical protein
MIHWDYKNEKLKDKAEVLFVKRSKSNVFEKAWVGTASNFRKDKYKGKDCIRFDVSDLIPTNSPKAYFEMPLGWHKWPTSDTQSKKISQEHDTYPRFFNLIHTCGWEDFENYCYILLRLLGIHDIHRFPQNDNRGKADGFFRFESLTVIYDSTLESEMIKKKEQQIDNYIAQIKADKIKYATQSYTISRTQKQVWLITRNEKSELIISEDQVKVKVVPVSKLIDIYQKRLNEEFSAEDLCNLLKDI